MSKVFFERFGEERMFENYTMSGTCIDWKLDKVWIAYQVALLKLEVTTGDDYIGVLFNMKVAM